MKNLMEFHFADVDIEDANGLLARSILAGDIRNHIRRRRRRVFSFYCASRLKLPIYFSPPFRRRILIGGELFRSSLIECRNVRLAIIVGRMQRAGRVIDSGPWYLSYGTNLPPVMK